MIKRSTVLWGMYLIFDVVAITICSSEGNIDAVAGWACACLLALILFIESLIEKK